MVTGYIYFLESDAVRNNNWIPTVDDVDIGTDFGVEGVEWCKLEIPTMWIKRFKTGIAVTDAGSATSFDMRTNRRGYEIITNGYETSPANAAKVEQFFMHDAHTSGAATTFYAYYMIIKMGTTTYVQFMDEGNTMRDYCPVRVSVGDIRWNDAEPLTVVLKLNIKSIWS